MHSSTVIAVLTFAATVNAAPLDTDFAVLRRSPGADSVLDALTNTQAVLFRGDSCTREASGRWTCEVDGVQLTGVLDQPARRSTPVERSEVPLLLRRAGGDGSPKTHAQERQLVLSSFAAYRNSATECRVNTERCDAAFVARLNLEATARTLAGGGKALSTFSCSAELEAGACIHSALGAGIVGINSNDETFLWAHAVDAQQVRFVSGFLERKGDTRRVITTVDARVEDALFPRTITSRIVQLGLLDVSNPTRPVENTPAPLLLTPTPPTCRTLGDCAVGSSTSLVVERAFAHTERVTVVCADRVVRTALPAPTMRVREIEDLSGVAVEFLHPLPCAALFVLTSEALSPGAMKPRLPNAHLPATPPWGRAELSWSGDLNGDGVLDVIARPVGEMGCGEYALWLSSPGGAWALAAVHRWYC